MVIAAVNPATGEQLESHREMVAGEVAAIVEDAHEAFLVWRKQSFHERAPCVRRMGELLRDRADEWARLMAREMGKPITVGMAEAKKCAICCDHFAEHAARMLAREDVATEALHSFVTFQPLGVVLAVMPWNFPFWQLFRFAAGAFMAGNAVVLKHASNVPGCALAIERIVREAGAPPNLLRTLLIGNKQVAAVIEHPHVRAVTLTGSGPAGRAVAARAGAMLKKTVLELGGSDAYLVLEDADPEAAAAICTRARLVNGGQSCIAGKRFIVVDAVREAFEQHFVEKMRGVRQGDPMDEATQIGPPARHDLRDTLHEQVRRSIHQGARCLLGGQPTPGPGAFYPPTVLTDVRKGMPAFDEELFGPVAAIVPAKDEGDAVELANDSVFGLGGCVMTRDAARGEHIAAERIEAGCVFVNDAVRSDRGCRSAASRTAGMAANSQPTASRSS